MYSLLERWRCAHVDNIVACVCGVVCQLVKSYALAAMDEYLTQSTVSQARGGSRWHRALTVVPNLAGSEVAAEPWLRSHPADLPALPCSAGLWPARQPADKLSDAGTTARAGRGRNSVQISALARPFHQVCMQSLPVMEHQRMGCKIAQLCCDWAALAHTVHRQLCIADLACNPWVGP